MVKEVTESCDFFFVCFHFDVFFSLYFIILNIFDHIHPFPKALRVLHPPYPPNFKFHLKKQAKQFYLLSLVYFLFNPYSSFQVHMDK